MRMGDVKVEYKIFCLICEWNTVKLSDKTLWSTFSRCPECGSHTDAVKIASSLDKVPNTQ